MAATPSRRRWCRIPGWFASIYSPETPEIGLQAALVGQPEP